MRPLVALVMACAFLPAAAADARWTFCVATAAQSREVWISEVIAATVERAKLEDEFKAAVTRGGATRVDAQCPAPRDDKTEAVNNRFLAEEFNRKLGAEVRAVSVELFPGRR